MTTSENDLALVAVWENAVNSSYRLGYANGARDGYNRAERDMARGWTIMFRGIRAVLDQPTADELEAARALTHEPCRMKCGACSSCVHSEAWRRNGCRPHQGAAA